jgi:hypothetical protein
MSAGRRYEGGHISSIEEYLLNRIYVVRADSLIVSSGMLDALSRVMCAQKTMMLPRDQRNSVA